MLFSPYISSLNQMLGFTWTAGIGCTGRSSERPILSEEEIERNVSGIKGILESLLTNREEDEGPKPLILNNLVCIPAFPTLLGFRVGLP